MNAPILVTDHDWFHFLSSRPDLDEVNFWRPSDKRTPRQLQPGMPVIFKLKKEHGDWIVGFGIFARHELLPAWLAWDAFEERNGAPTFADMRERIERLRRSTGAEAPNAGDYEIGCLMITQPVFLPQERWVRPPVDWPANAVQGKAYDLSGGEGARVWAELQRSAGPKVLEAIGVAEAADEPRYGEPMLVKPRLGQGIFRLAVTDAYGRACAVTTEHSLPALEAAHIKPYAEGGRHEVRNGLLLRSDIHRLFDKGYVGVTPDYEFVVSERLRGDYSNGRSYYPHGGQRIHLPEAAGDRPDRELLEWRQANVFRA